MADTHDDCIFCKVLSGEIPSQKIYEDEHAITVMDINPWTRGHAVVIPRKHATDIFEIEDDELAQVAIAAVPTAIAGIYGMNFKHMPELTWSFGYPAAILLMALICFGLYRRFKQAGWL